jgi:hypothetical protein
MRRSTWWSVAVVAVVVAACSGDDGASTTTTSPPRPPETTTTTEPPIEAGEQIFVYTPAVGDCFDRRRLDRPAEDSATRQTDIVLKLDCSLPHDNEVIGVLEQPEEGGYPGEDPLLAFARNNCVDAFEPYIGRAYEVSTLELGYYLPSQVEWDEGVRVIGCYVYDVSGAKLVGSVAGSGR